MKKIIYLMSLLTLTLASCEKDEKATYDGNAKVTTTLSTESVVLEKDNANQTALTVTWESTPVNVNVAKPLYEIVFTNGAKSASETASESPAVFTVAQLNRIMLNISAEADKEATISVAVKRKLGANHYVNFTEKNLKVTPYKDLITPTDWGLVGSAAPNGWDGPDVPFWKSIEDDSQFVAYVTLKDGEIKFRKDNKWDVNLGGSNGTLTDGGDNIKVTAGTYKILLNVTAKTYSIEPYTLGIVGDGANGWEENQDKDIKLAYDGATNTWKAENVTLKDGQIKFRLNNAWAVNYGADTATEPATEQSGALIAGGKNIKSHAGKHNVTFSFDEKTKKGTYKLEKL
ncbi:SusE domain-containing protein [Capnocytophaga sp.]|uniref:SusE domain-containing protein n=1 Tax=Capnocytophaga sp. TaxID=44737 RepID=UPI0026DC69D7|nr:SusE domain-containing protein [Capnocytophaga sp.]MDO5105785.1 SusE domain-containing protein [Capnocytophaga sp.]